MFEKYEQKYDRNKAILALLITMIKVDQDVDPIEEQFISDISTQLNIQSADLEEIYADPKAFILKPPKDEMDRMTILYYLLFAMRIDGQIKPEEEALCYKAGLKLGFNHLMVSDLIRVMKKYLHEDVPPEAMLREVRKYLN